MKIEIELSGVSELLGELGKMSDRAATALVGGLVEEAENIMVKAKRLTPVDTGTLRSTGRVARPQVGAQTVRVDMTFGGPAAPYAFWVHERMDLRHNDPTQAKFLEQPMKEAAPSFGDRVGRRFEQRLTGGG